MTSTTIFLLGPKFTRHLLAGFTIMAPALSPSTVSFKLPTGYLPKITVAKFKNGPFKIDSGKTHTRNQTPTPLLLRFRMNGFHQTQQQIKNSKIKN